MSVRHPVDVIIVGGGHNGLVAGCYLAQAGLETLVLEALPTIGGMSGCDRPIPDAPSHVMHPCAVDLFLMRSSTVPDDLRLAEAGFRQIDIDPGYVHLAADSASIAFWRDPRRTADEIARFSRQDASQYLELHRVLDAAVRISAPFLATNILRPPARLLARAAATAVRDHGPLRGLFDVILTPPTQTLAERFEHPIVRNALASLLGQVGPLSSRDTGPGFLMLPHLHRYGVGRPVGGMQALMDALVRRLEWSGGSVQTSAPVEEVLVAHGRAIGVRLVGGEELHAQIGVVGACDPRVLLDRLLPPGVLPDKVIRRVRRLPANADGAGELKVDVALSGQVRLTRFEKWRGDGLDLRVPVAVVGSVEDFTRGYPLAAAGILSESLPAWLYITSAADPSLAPEGQDSLYLYSACVPLEPAEPPDEYRERAGKALVAAAAGYYEGMESNELGRRTLTSADMAVKYNVKNGSLFHIDMDLLHVGPLRPAWGLAGYRTPVSGLYLTGAGTHPGAGVGGYAGQNAAREVLRDARRRKHGTPIEHRRTRRLSSSLRTPWAHPVGGFQRAPNR